LSFNSRASVVSPVAAGQVGISAVDVLRAATVTPAALFPAVSAGSISSGRRGNLVLLDGNPLENVRTCPAFVLLSLAPGCTSGGRSTTC
jgi:imidazolonepropionase-like amidohydrolase